MAPRARSECNGARCYTNVVRLAVSLISWQATAAFPDTTGPSHDATVTSHDTTAASPNATEASHDTTVTSHGTTGASPDTTEGFNVT